MQGRHTFRGKKPPARFPLPSSFRRSTSVGMEGDSSSKRSESKKPSESSSSPSLSSDGELLARWNSLHSRLSDGHPNASSKGGKHDIGERRKKWKYWKRYIKEERRRRRRQDRRLQRRKRNAQDSDSKESCRSDRVGKDDDGSEPEMRNPELVVPYIMKRFPGTAADPKQRIYVPSNGIWKLAVAKERGKKTSQSRRAEIIDNAKSLMG